MSFIRISPVWALTVGTRIDRGVPRCAGAPRRVRRRNSAIARLMAGVSTACKALSVLAGTVLLIQGCVLQSFYVPSLSMAPTLQTSDCLMVPKLAYGLHIPFFDRSLMSWSSPERGHVVVFHREDDALTSIDESGQALVKRVIGIAGDTVTVVGAHVFVNGSLLEEPYARWAQGGDRDPRSFTVPEGKVFVLGDNRDDSYDSRSWAQPFVPVDRVVGPASVVYWSDTEPARVIY